MFFELWKDNRLGIANGNGQISIPVEYTALLWDDGKRGLFAKDKEEQCIEFQTGKKLGEHCDILKPVNDDFRAYKPTDFPNTYTMGLRSARFFTKYGYVDKTEHFVIAPEYDEAGDFAEVDGKIMARVKMGQYEGFINKNGKPVIPITYKESNVFFEKYLVDGKTKSLLIVRKGSLFGIIDSENQEVVPFNYEDILSITRFKNKTIFVARQEEEYGVFDLSGKLLLPRLFNSIKLIGPGRFEVVGDEERYEFDLETNVLKEIVVKTD